MDRVAFFGKLILRPRFVKQWPVRDERGKGVVATDGYKFIIHLIPLHEARSHPHRYSAALWHVIFMQYTDLFDVAGLIYGVKGVSDS